MDPVVGLTLRASLAVLFLTAAVHKLRDPRSFRATLAAYRLLPAALVPAAAAVVALAEVATALLLSIPGWSVAGGVLGAGLLTLYGGAMAINLVRGRRDIDCGCVGPSAYRPIGWGLVVRNVMVAAAGLATLLPVDGRALVWMDLFTVGAATAALAACQAAATRMLALGPAVVRLRGGT